MTRCNDFGSRRTPHLSLGGRQTARLLVLGFLCCASGAGAHQSLDVFTLTPMVAEPGDRVTITGQGLLGPVDEYFAWLRTADAAIVLKPVASDAVGGVESLEADLEVAAVAEAGSLELWRGRSHPVPDHTIWSQGRLVTGFDGQVFIASEQSAGPSLTVLTATPEALVAPFDSEWISVDLADLPPQLFAFIRLTVVIETSSGCNQTASSNRWLTDEASPGFERSRIASIGPGPLGTASAATGPRWMLEVSVQPDRPLSDPEAWAAALAELLNQMFGSLGLSASAEGSVLTICSVDCLHFGAAILHVK